MFSVRSTIALSLLLLAGTASIAEAQSSRRADDNRRQARDRDDRRQDRTPSRQSRPTQQRQADDQRDDQDDANSDDARDDRSARPDRRARPSPSRTAQPTRAQPTRAQPAQRDQQRPTTTRPTSRTNTSSNSNPARSPAPAAPAQLRAPAGQNLVLTTNDDQQQIEVVLGPADGQVQVVGINGGSEQNFSNVGALRLVTGSNQDAITLAIRTPVPPRITIETGLGESDVKLVYEVPQSNRNAISDVLVLGGPQNDKLLLEGVALTRSFAANWDARLGDGDNEVVAKMNQPTSAAFTNVFLAAQTGSGQDKVEYDIISSASAQDLRVVASTGAGQDSAIFKFDGQSPANTAATFALDLGAGQDQAETIIVSRGGQATLTGDARGGDGDDTIKLLLEGNGVANTTLQGDAGNDLLDIEFKGIVRGQTRQLAGLGDDFLKLIVVGPRRILPFMDGGPGFDAAIGFGQIVNVEQIDRQ